MLGELLDAVEPGDLSAGDAIRAGLSGLTPARRADADGPRE
jgi:hypothetical protein